MRDLRLVVYLVVIVICVALTCLIYNWSDDDCVRRGGHTEWIYGGRGGWVCEGADR